MNMRRKDHNMNSDPIGFVNVASIIPFWRYAVGPTSERTPAIPCYTLKAATKLFKEARRELPWAGVILYRRKGWGGIVRLWEYRPDKETAK